MPPRIFSQQSFGNSSQDFSTIETRQVSLSFENLKRAAGAVPLNDDSSRDVALSTNKTSTMKSGGYSFFPPKRRARHAVVVSSALPEIPITVAPPIAEARDSFSWADLPQSSRHFSPVDEYELNSCPPEENARTC